MEDFLNKLQISENAVRIYLKCIGEVPLTEDEIQLILPGLGKEKSVSALKELISMGLIIPIHPKSTKLLTHYSVVPPFRALSDYYENIKENAETIGRKLSKIIEESLDTLFRENELIELESVYNASEELKKDIEEETIIQKQEVEDIVDGMENLRILSDILDDLHNKIKAVTQSEFTSLIKILPEIEKELITQVGKKKYRAEISEIIEKVFKRNFDKLVNEFTARLHELIQKDFKYTLESMENIMNSTFQFRDDFKMLLLNMLNNFETKMISVLEIIKNKNSSLKEQKQSFKKLLLKELMEINKNSINSIVSLNEPVKDVLENSLELVKSKDKDKISEIYNVYSLVKVKSEIDSFLKNTKKELILILPVIENFILPEQITKISYRLKMASSEAHTNSIVKQLKSNPNLEYRTLKNPSVIMLKGDNDQLMIGVIRESTQSEYKDFLGFTTDNKDLIKILEPAIKSIWEIGSSDTFQTPKSVGIDGNLELISKHLKAKDEIIIKSEVQEDKEIKRSQLEQDIPIENKEPPPIEVPMKKEIEEPSQIHPKTKDQNGIIINDAFNTLIQKLPSIKGAEFSNELQKVADLILEKKGFSVTLHKVRSVINQFKFKEDLLNELDRKQIVASIGDWKARLF